MFLFCLCVCCSSLPDNLPHNTPSLHVVSAYRSRPSLTSSLALSLSLVLCCCLALSLSHRYTGTLIHFFLCRKGLFDFLFLGSRFSFSFFSLWPWLRPSNAQQALMIGSASQTHPPAQWPAPPPQVAGRQTTPSQPFCRQTGLGAITIPPRGTQEYVSDLNLARHKAIADVHYSQKC